MNLFFHSTSYALNCLVIGDFDGVIRMVLPAWPGSYHDSRVYRVSEGKRLIEAQDRYMIAGDSAFCLTDTTITPYPNPANRAETLYNRKLSGLRTKATENIFGRWKHQFPILSGGIRTDVRSAPAIVMACAMLYNFIHPTDAEGVRSLPLAEPQLVHPEPAGPPPPLQYGNAAGIQRRNEVRDHVQAEFQQRRGR